MRMNANIYGKASTPMKNSTENILELMRHGVDYKFKVKLRSFEITFRPLTELETTTIADETRDFLLSLKADHQTDLKYSAVFANKTLQLASTSAPGKTDYQITETILTKCTPDEVMYLFNEYNRCVEKVNPNIEKMKSDELHALVEQAKKKVLVTTGLSFWQLENLCHALIEEILQQGK